MRDSMGGGPQVEHAREQHHKALREVQQSEEHAWAEAAARVTTLREEHQAAMRKTERQAELRLDEANRRLEVVREELAQAETQRTRLAAAQVSSWIRWAMLRPLASHKQSVDA